MCTHTTHASPNSSITANDGFSNPCPAGGAVGGTHGRSSRLYVYSVPSSAQLLDLPNSEPALNLLPIASNTRLRIPLASSSSKSSPYLSPLAVNTHHHIDAFPLCYQPSHLQPSPAVLHGNHYPMSGLQCEHKPIPPHHNPTPRHRGLLIPPQRPLPAP